MLVPPIRYTDGGMIYDNGIFARDEALRGVFSDLKRTVRR